jgi:hypothetical protein
MLCTDIKIYEVCVRRGRKAFKEFNVLAYINNISIACNANICNVC